MLKLIWVFLNLWLDLTSEPGKEQIIFVISWSVKLMKEGGLSFPRAWAAVGKIYMSSSWQEFLVNETQHIVIH